MGIQEAQRRLLNRFVIRIDEAMRQRSWAVDVEHPADPGGMFLGSFRQPVEHEFVATVEITLESSLIGGFTGFHRLQTPQARVGGEPGVRHLATERLIGALGVRSEVGISRDLEDVFNAAGDDLLTITDEASSDRASDMLIACVDAHALSFAQQHADVDAMLSFITRGGQRNRSEMFVPLLLAGSGR